jgi:hypothetical protein
LQTAIARQHGLLPEIIHRRGLRLAMQKLEDSVHLADGAEAGI